MSQWKVPESIGSHCTSYWRAVSPSWRSTSQHIKAVPSRKTDVHDAEWIVDLLRHGLQASFIPPQSQRDLRDLTRQRTNLVADHGTVVKRLQKVLEWSNIKLASVVSDVLGLSARAMLEAIIAGQADASLLADLAKERLRSKQATLVRALEGTVRDHHRFMLAQHLAPDRLSGRAS